MNEQNLIPRPFKSGEQAKMMGRKGGLSRSPKKAYMARLSALKRQGLKNENYQTLISLMEDPAASVLNMRMYIESWKSKARNPTEAALLARVENGIHQSHFGTKQTNLNVNLEAGQVPMVEVLRRVSKKIEEDEKQ